MEEEEEGEGKGHKELSRSDQQIPILLSQPDWAQYCFITSLLLSSWPDLTCCRDDGGALPARPQPEPGGGPGRGDRVGLTGRVRGGPGELPGENQWELHWLLRGAGLQDSLQTDEGGLPPTPAHPPGSRAAQQLQQVSRQDNPSGDQSEQEAELRVQRLCPADSVASQGEQRALVVTSLTSLTSLTSSDCCWRNEGALYRDHLPTNQPHYNVKKGETDSSKTSQPSPILTLLTILEKCWEIWQKISILAGNLDKIKTKLWLKLPRPYSSWENMKKMFEG